MLFVDTDNKKFDFWFLYSADLAKTLILVCWYRVWHWSSSVISSINLFCFSSNFLVCSSKWSLQLLCCNSAARFWYPLKFVWNVIKYFNPDLQWNIWKFQYCQFVYQLCQLLSILKYFSFTETSMKRGCINNER